MDEDLRDMINFKNAHGLVHRFSKQMAKHEASPEPEEQHATHSEL